MRLACVPVAGLIIAAVLGGSTPATAHPNLLFHWPRYGTPVISIANHTRFGQDLERARADWDSHTILQLAMSGGASDVEVLEGAYGDLGWAAATGLEANGWHILKATIYYNTTYSNGRDQRQGIFCHELGHAFGLDHGPQGCMGLNYYPTGTTTTVQHNWDDIYAMYHTAHDECGATGCTPPGTCYVECCNRQSSAFYTGDQLACGRADPCGASCGVRNRLFVPQGGSTIWLYGPDTNPFCATTAVQYACAPPGTCYLECCNPHGLFDVSHTASQAHCAARSACGGNGGIRNRLFLRDGSAGPADWLYHNAGC